MLLWKVAYVSIQEISCEQVITVIMVKEVPPVLVLAGPEMNLSTL